MRINLNVNKSSILEEALSTSQKSAIGAGVLGAGIGYQMLTGNDSGEVEKPEVRTPEVKPEPTIETIAKQDPGNLSKEIDTKHQAAADSIRNSRAGMDQDAADMKQKMAQIKAEVIPEQKPDLSTKKLFSYEELEGYKNQLKPSSAIDSLNQPRHEMNIDKPSIMEHLKNKLNVGNINNFSLGTQAEATPINNFVPEFNSKEEFNNAYNQSIATDPSDENIRRWINSSDKHGFTKAYN